MEYVNIEKYAAGAEPEHMHLQALISDRTQHVSTSQKAPLQEKENDLLRTLKCVAFPFFLGIPIK